MLVAGDDPSELVPLEEVERRYILRVLEAVGGNKTLAAQMLGIDRKTLYRKLEQYGVGGGGDQESAGYLNERAKSSSIAGGRCRAGSACRCRRSAGAVIAGVALPTPCRSSATSASRS